MFAGKLVTKHTSANRRKFSQQSSAAVATSESGGGIDNFGFIGIELSEGDEMTMRFANAMMMILIQDSVESNYRGRRMREISIQDSVESS